MASVIYIPYTVFVGEKITEGLPVQIVLDSTRFGDMDKLPKALRFRAVSEVVVDYIPVSYILKDLTWPKSGFITTCRRERAQNTIRELVDSLFDMDKKFRVEELTPKLIFEGRVPLYLGWSVDNGSLGSLPSVRGKHDYRSRHQRVIG